MKQLKDVVLLLCTNLWSDIWYYIDIIILIAGAMANIPLLCLFLRERKTLSASQVLGVNLVLMNLIYLSILPVSLVLDQGKKRQNHSDSSDTESTPLDVARDIFSMFNLVGCPLLLSCMCIERYLAVLRPVLYLKVRKWEYRMVVSAVVWCVTLSFCFTTGFVDDIANIMVPVSIMISALFLIMLTCLGCMVHALWQQSPAHTSFGKQARSESPRNRKTLQNVSVVVLSAVISYLPVLVMVPIRYSVTTGNIEYLINSLCVVSELYVLFPRFGVFIGPLFYFSRARQMCCHQGTGKTFNE